MTDPRIPRALVAQALMVAPETLPEGDLPLSRFAERHLALLSADEDAFTEHPDVWTADLMFDLVHDHPDLALDAVRATLDRCTRPEEVALLAAGPMEDLLSEHGAAMIARFEEEARGSDRFRYALTGIWRNEIAPMVWARVEAARKGPSLDAGDPLPEA